MKPVIKLQATQRGATLVVALIILAVMTILGVATMQSSTLQERMANNARQKLIADSAAESALREAEEWLLNEVTNRTRIADHFLSSPSQGCYANRTVRQLSRVANRPLSSHIVDLSDDNNWITDLSLSRSVKDINADWEDGDWARTPRIVIELLGQIRLGDRTGTSGNSQNIDDGIDVFFNSPWVFRITAIGWSKNPDIYSVLQSTFTTGRQFGG